MHFDVKSRTILYVRHGSHAYGLNTPESDEDFKGVCIKPKDCYFGFMKSFEQLEHMGSKDDGQDSVTYSLEKFARLAADCNPNIIEVLHVADADVVSCDEYGERLRAIAGEFLSKKAKHTFSGYAFAQLKRIKTHRSWLLNPPAEAPDRKKYGLGEVTKITPSEFGAIEATLASGVDIELPKDVMTLFVRERNYKAAKDQFDQYQTWKRSRNPKRAELEAKFGYDTKHGMHLVRLLKMCVEILRDHKVNVKRTDDRDELLAIRSGAVPYDPLIERADALVAAIEALYVSSTLRREPDRTRLDDFIVELTNDYLSKKG